MGKGFPPEVLAAVELLVMTLHENKVPLHEGQLALAGIFLSTSIRQKRPKKQVLEFVDKFYDAVVIANEKYDKFGWWEGKGEDNAGT